MLDFKTQFRINQERFTELTAELEFSIWYDIDNQEEIMQELKEIDAWFNPDH